MNLLFSLHRKLKVSEFQCFKVFETMKPSFRLPFPPRTRGTGRIEHLGTSCQLSAVSSQPNQKPDTKTNSVIPSEGAFQPKRGITVSSGPRTQQLPLRELEA